MWFYYDKKICRTLKSLIDASIELQLRIELAIDGFLLGDRGTFVTSELLKLILKRRRAFEEFRPRSWWTVPYSPTGDKKFEVSDGVWAYTPNNLPDTSFKDIKFEELTPPDCKGGRWELSWDDIGLNAMDLSFWLDADALFLLEQRNDGNIWRIHFRRLSTNERHPRATVPFLDFMRDDRDIWENCEVISFEERLSVEFFDTRAKGCKRTAAIILDWTTGEELLPYTVMSDMAFLTKDLIVLGRGSEADRDLITLEVRSLSDKCALFRCNLPLSSADVGLRFLKHPASNHRTNNPTQFGKMFIPDPRVSILAIVFRPKGAFIAEERRNTVVLSIHKFLQKGEELLGRSLVDRIEAQPEEITPVLTFEWQEWGPTVTRWLPNHIRGHYGSRMVYGSKMLAVYSYIVDGIEHLHDMLMDFNVRKITPGLRDVNDPDVSLKFFAEESEWYGYGDIVESSLPYRAWVSVVESNYLNLFLDANTIVGRLPNSYECFSFLPQSAVGLRYMPPRKL